VTSGNANVTLADVAGESYVHTSFGSVKIINAQGPVTVENQNGAVHVTGAKNSVNAKTSFGAIEINGAGGAVDVSDNSGSIAVGGLGSKCQPVTARTSFGSLRVALPVNVGYDVSANTSFGRIKSEFEVTVGAGHVMGEGRLEGRIGSGGCRLQLTNANGNIDINKGAM